ncbi:hypothetical protein ABB37_06059 [Leptomonas pyrrhocoris]|uniref:RRM domain-containing protein n=1 Tax=Leptomonas pyrrhocoris TaxID=157538 RepID=A0A0N0DUE1_LEPPY|nr:hypothetical protein ABB37_06059 [Leptomonas pyrrhocoris]KPA78431.1 hypothetical protein ABB37_06059 [Leptomonas pyrrhocoris]|eukprot:XP_015656870.1 hypothetical protein ABB37_06059 [Leptomonas pyrrhocoris]
MVNAAAVVYVFLGDAEKAVTMEDIKEWLQIIDDVVEIKLQYDAAAKRTCYSVEFRKHTSAQQAVQYLDGARFKNCVVSIRSRVFAAVEADAPHAAYASANDAQVASSSAVLNSVSSSSLTRKRCRETGELPCNHLLPADLQMDQLLVEQLSDASTTEGSEEVAAHWRNLKTLQEELTMTYSDLRTAQEDLTAADARLAKLLHVHPSVANDDATKANHVSAGAKAAPYPLAARRCVSHQRGILTDAHTPNSVVSFVTSSFGPISFCSVTATPREFFLVLKFVFLADEERFLAAAATGGSVNNQGLSARSEKERALLRLLWASIDFTLTPRDFAALSPAEANRQQAVRQLLS